MSDSESSLGPRKRKETSRVTDNADPLLARKKAKLAPKAQTKKPVTKTSTKAAGTSGSKPVTKTKMTNVHSNIQTTVPSKNTATTSSTRALHRHRSVEMEEVVDEAAVVRGKQPLNPSRIIEAADGSDDDVMYDPAPDLIEVDDEQEEEKEAEAEVEEVEVEEVENPEESDESELRECIIYFQL
jgi:hypothetical protein